MFQRSAKRIMRLHLISVMLAAGASSSRAFALHAFDDEYQSPATFALQFKKTSMFWSDARLGYFEGTIRNNQTAIKHYDRRFGLGGGLGLERPTAPNLSFRLDLRGEAVLRRQLDNAEPETIVDEKYLYLRPLLGMTYITPAGLELFVGAVYSMYPAYNQKFDGANDSTSTKYASSRVLAPHIGLTKRGGVGAGGFYYQFGKEEKRAVTKNSSDGTVLDMTQVVQEPTMVGVFGMFNASGVLWTVDAAAISEGEGGDRTETGTTIRDDNLKLSVNGLWNDAFKGGLSYRTARYSKSAYMDLDSIPMFAAKGLWLFGVPAGKGHFGVITAFGRDKQSIPELNAHYEVNAFTLVMGVTSGF